MNAHIIGAPPGLDDRLGSALARYKAFDAFLGQLSKVIRRSIDLEHALEDPKADIASAIAALQMTWCLLKADLALLQGIVRRDAGLVAHGQGISVLTRPAIRLAYEALCRVFPTTLLHVAHHGAGNRELFNTLYFFAERVADDEGVLFAVDEGEAQSDSERRLASWGAQEPVDHIAERSLPPIDHQGGRWHEGFAMPKVRSEPAIGPHRAARGLRCRTRTQRNRGET